MVTISVDVAESFTLKSFELELKHFLFVLQIMVSCGVLHVLFIQLYRNAQADILANTMKCG